MNYIDELATKILSAVPTDRLPPGDNLPLFRRYAALALAKGNQTTLEDVHNCWAGWMADIDQDHESLVPFEELDPEVRQEDAPFLEAIHQGTSDQGEFANLHSLRSAARYCNVSVTSVKNWIYAGRLKAEWANGRTYIREDDLDKIAAERKFGNLKPIFKTN